VRSPTYLFTTLCTSIQIFGEIRFQTELNGLRMTPHRDVVPARTSGAPARAVPRGACHLSVRALPARLPEAPRAFPRPYAPQDALKSSPRHAFAARPHRLLPTGPPRVPARAPPEAPPYHAGTLSHSSRPPIKPSHARLLARVCTSTSPCSTTGRH
jgi:hypothetical protein